MRFFHYAAAETFLEELKIKLAAGTVELLDENDKVIPYLGTNVEAGSDPAWDRVCIDTDEDPAAPFNVIVSHFPEGSLKNRLLPININIAKTREEAPKRVMPTPAESLAFHKANIMGRLV